MFDAMVILKQLACFNPKYAEIVNALNNGQNPQQLFYELAKKMNVDPQQVLDKINLFSKL